MRAEPVGDARIGGAKGRWERILGFGGEENLCLCVSVSVSLPLPLQETRRVHHKPCQGDGTNISRLAA